MGMKAGIGMIEDPIFSLLCAEFEFVEPVVVTGLTQTYQVTTERFKYTVLKKIAERFDVREIELYRLQNDIYQMKITLKP